VTTDENTEDTIIEGEATDVTPSRAVAVVPQAAVQSSLIVGGTAGLALMSDKKFEENLAALVVLRKRVDQVKKALMKPGIDYGVIPGTDKPALLKPGTETLMRTFGLADSYVLERHIGDGETTPDYEIIAHARIHIGDTSGPIIAEGVGTANTWETKHRYRGSNGRLCPNCGKENVIHSKPPRIGWWCGTRDGGCGGSFIEDDKRITDQPDPGKAENVDPWDLANTVTKMAKKRSLVDGVLTATGTSGIFTQDEDAPGLAPRQNAPGAAGGANPPSGATGGGGAQPDGPAGLQGIVEKDPDGIRHVKVTRLAGTEHAKLEVVMKVGTRRHTSMLLDDAANRALGLELRAGEVVRIIGGQVEEVIWQEGKPPKKELWGATDVAVLRGGAWILGETFVPSLPLEDPAGRGPETQPRSGTDAEADPTPPVASASPSATTTAGQTASPASTRSAATPSSPPALARGEEDAIVTLKVRLIQSISFVKTGDGRAAAILRGAILDDTGEIVQAVLGDDPEGEIEAQLGTKAAPAYGEGSDVTIFGLWKSGWVILTAVGAAVPG